MLLIWSSCCRLGEAANPGPQDLDHASSFTIGAFNPSGLRGKAHFVSTHMAQGDIWAVSETHLDAKSLGDFRLSLKCSNSPLKYHVAGKCVGARASGSHAWKGVSVLSRHPTRRLVPSWSSDIENTSRVLLTTTMLQDVWVSGGVIYGEPDGHLYPNHKEHNEALVQAVSAHVGQLLVGPRYIAGDFNETEGSLSAFDGLRAMGFLDLQELALKWWGRPLQSTCKNRTRKDFVFVSPELQSLLIDVEVIDDVWPDHAVLMWRFQGFKHAPKRSIWPVPQPFPWPGTFEVAPDWWNLHAPDPTQQYADLWNYLEGQAVKALPFDVSTHSKGRANVFAPVLAKRGVVSPVKCGRLTDFQPNFQGVSTKHAQFVRQTRRLQSYMRFLQASHAPDELHGSRLWGSILRAKGFEPDFPQWWAQCGFCVSGAPPVVPPTLDVAVSMFETVVLAVRNMEKQLIASSKQYARFRRARDPNVIFKDIKAPPAQGLELLRSTVSAQVTEVVADESLVRLDSSCDWYPDLPLVSQGRCLEVIHAEADCLWLEDVSSLQAGSVVTQVRHKGAVQDICQDLINEWGSRWQRHAGVPPERWHAILAFAKRFLPRNTLSWPAISVEDLRSVIQRKKTSTSSGLDGVSITDLRSMPTAALANFCRIFSGAEISGLWPQQMVDGKVSCIAKNSDPQGVLEFRPITVLGLLYRCWSSFHARAAIRALDSILPATLFGSRPGCFATQVWSRLLWSVEHAMVEDIALSGLAADIVKAFNHLPRLVVFETCCWLGLPQPLLIGWCGAISAMQRRFQVRGCLSDPVDSHTGFAEGDALSCVAMLVVDVLFHSWHQHFFPLCTPISFVDDWQILSCIPGELPQILCCLEKFVEALDLILDSKKTFVWSVCPQERSALRQAGIRTELNGRALGAHVQFCRRHSNTTQMTRIGQLAELWPRLRGSAGSYDQKVRAIRVAAWPRGLHAIAATTVSLATFQTMRAGAVKALGADGAGVNAHVHLGLVHEPSLDPQFYAIIQTLRTVQLCGDPAGVKEQLVHLVAGGAAPENGITATLLTRLQALGWFVDGAGHIVDSFGSFSLFRLSHAELLLRAEWSWLRVVAAEVAHRPGFLHLDLVDPPQTRAWVRTLPITDRGLFRKLLNGAHLTQDGKKYCQTGGDDICPYCACSDSRFHRFYQCEHFASLHDALPRDLFVLAPKLPEVVTCYGWSLRPSTLQAWYAMLAGVPVVRVFPVSTEASHVHLFTDGSCKNQHCKFTRFAAWSVICAGPDCTLKSSEVVAAGPLPGILQSACRAEVYAVLQAVAAAPDASAKVTIWTDCASVVATFRSLLRTSQLPAGVSHADLWRDVLAGLLSSPCDFDIVHVSAHQSWDVQDALAEWCFRHNDLADRTTVRANLTRGVEFWQLLHDHVETVVTTMRISREFQQHLLRISRAVMQEEACVEEDFVAPVVTCSDPAPSAWPGLIENVDLPPGAVRWYGAELVNHLLSWFFGVLQQEQGPLVWVPHCQLYLDYQLATGAPGPVKVGRWVDGRTLPSLQVANLLFAVRVRAFVKVLKESLRHAGQGFTYQYGLPKSSVLAFHTGTLALPWPAIRLQFVDQELLRYVPEGVRRTGTALKVIPVVKKDVRFPDVVHLWFQSRLAALQAPSSEMIEKLQAVPGSLEVCRFGMSCQRAGCWYSHPAGRLIDLNPTKALCFRGAECDKFDCHRSVPVLLWYGNLTHKSPQPMFSQLFFPEFRTEMAPPLDFLIFLDEIPMPFRPDVKPGPGDREVFIDPLPAEPGSDELQEFLAAFGEVDEVAWARSWSAGAVRQNGKQFAKVMAGPGLDGFDLVQCGKTLKAYAQRSDWRAAVELLSTLEAGSTRANVILYSTVVTCCERCHQWTAALQLLNWAQKQSIEADTILYNSVISACVKGSEWQGALQLLRGMQDHSIPASVISFNSALSAPAGRVTWRLTQLLLAELQERQLQATVVSYNSAISASVASWSLALALVAELHLKELQPDLISYNAAMDAIGSWRRAQQLRSSMAASAQPDVVTLGAVLTGNRWERSLQQVQTEKHQLNIVVCNAAMASCGSLWLRASSLLTEAVALELQPASRSQNILLSTLNAWQDALTFLRKAKGLGIESDAITFNSIMKICQPAWDIASLALKEMQMLQIRSDLISYSSLMGEEEENPTRGWWTAAALVLVLRQKLGLQLRLDAIAANSLLGAVSDVGWQVSLDILATHIHQSLRADVVAMNEASVALARSLKWRRAFSFISDHSSTGLMGGAPDLSLVSFNAAAAATGGEGRWDLALDVMMCLERHGASPDIITFNSAMNSCKKSEKWSRAVGILAAAAQRHLCPSLITFNALISACETRWRLGLMMLPEVQRSGAANVITCSSIISTAGNRLGTWQIVSDLYWGEMPLQRLQPSVLTTSALLSSMSHSNCWKHVLELLQPACCEENPAINALNYCTAVSSTSLAGQLDYATRLLGELEGLSSSQLRFAADESVVPKGAAAARQVERLQ
eukprot:s322_g3.t1